MKKIIFIISFIIYSTTLYAFNLEDGFKFALENDMDSKVNENNLKNIQYDQDIADSLLYPKVDFTATVENSKRTDGQKTPSSGEHTKSDLYEFQLTQPVFDGFEAKYEKQLQQKMYESAVFYLKEGQNDLAINYVQSYINVLSEKDLLTLSHESVSISEDIFKKVYKKINSGYGTKLEYEEVKGNLAESKVNVETARINFKEALEGLKYYVQEDFDSSELRKPSFITPLPKTLDNAVDMAFKENPTINVAKVNLSVSIAEEKKARKEFFPTLNLVGTYNLNDSFYPNGDDEYNEYTIGLELSYNLYNGGKNTAEVKKALQDIKEKQYLIKKSEYQVKNKVRLAWNSYKLNKDKNESLKQYVIVKKDILDATFKEFDLGLQDLNTLLENYIDYMDVKKDYIANTYDLLYAKYNLLGSIGKLSDALLGKLPTLKDEEEIDSIIKENPEIFKVPDYNYESGLKRENDKLKVANVKKLLQKEDNEPKISKNSFETNPEQVDNQTFKNKFLNAKNNKYTINLALAYNKTDAQKFLDKYNLNLDAFYFSFGYEKPLFKIMLGIYDTKQEAKEVLQNLDSNLKRNKPLIEKISLKQNLYKKYHGTLDIKPEEYTKNNQLLNIQKVSFVETSTIKTAEKKSFKEKFLKASKSKYTINLAYSQTAKGAQNFLDKHQLLNNAFYFSFGYEKPLQKIMYGVFDTKQEAKEALDSLSKQLKQNNPRIEKVTIKQNLYKKYHPNSYNSIFSGSI